MRGGGHYGLGILYYVTTVAIVGGNLNNYVVLAAGIIGLLPDVDILLNIKHRKYTHNVPGALLLSLIVFIGGFYLFDFMTAIAFVSALSSHYMADFVYCKKLKKILAKMFKENSIDYSEYISTLVLGMSVSISIAILFYHTFWIVGIIAIITPLIL